MVTRSTLLLVLFMGGVVAWRTPGAVDALERDPWLLVAEAASLAVVGVAFWSELVESGPLIARSRRPFRAVMAAVAMWTVWTVAYLLGFSSSAWYPAFHHVAGHGLSTIADQQLSTGVLWFFAAVAFVPVVFRNLFVWLRAQDDADVGNYGSLTGRA